ncbi:MAG: choice-of-anchor tandem repeat GloVer-containing protein [Rhizomicrobium sp.]
MPAVASQSFHVLYNFTGASDGGTPTGDLVVDGRGAIYGTTVHGGAKSLGVVFKLAQSGKESVLHAFAGGSDGASSYAGLSIGQDGISTATPARAVVRMRALVDAAQFSRLRRRATKAFCIASAAATMARRWIGR